MWRLHDKHGKRSKMIGITRESDYDIVASVGSDSTSVKLIALSKAFIQRTYRHEKFELTDAISLSLFRDFIFSPLQFRLNDFPALPCSTFKWTRMYVYRVFYMKLTTQFSFKLFAMAKNNSNKTCVVSRSTTHGSHKFCLGDYALFFLFF